MSHAKLFWSTESCSLYTSHKKYDSLANLCADIDCKKILHNFFDILK
jgi:hypothetical protein